MIISSPWEKILVWRSTGINFYEQNLKQNLRFLHFDTHKQFPSPHTTYGALCLDYSQKTDEMKKWRDQRRTRLQYGRREILMRVKRRDFSPNLPVVSNLSRKGDRCPSFPSKSFRKIPDGRKRNHNDLRSQTQSLSLASFLAIEERWIGINRILTLLLQKMFHLQLSKVRRRILPIMTGNSTSTEGASTLERNQAR